MPKRGFRAALYTPWAVTFVVFWLFPLFFAIYLSFTDYSPLGGSLAPTGAVNYVRMLQDSDFWQAVRNTVVFVVGTVPVTTALALGLALLLNSQIRGRGICRAAFFFPSNMESVSLSTSAFLSSLSTL